MNPLNQPAPSSSTEILLPPSFPQWVKRAAQVISIVLHPLFVPLIGAWLIAETHYYDFAGFQPKNYIQFYGAIAANAVLLPAFTVFFLKKLHFISSYQMRQKSDRIIPYIAVMTFYFWTYMVFKRQLMMPDVVKAFLLGNFIAVILAFLSNIRMKTSMHATGMGGLLGLVFCFMETPYVAVFLPLVVVLFAAGLVTTCRMILGAHSYREIYMGAAFGVFAQLLAFWII